MQWLAAAGAESWQCAPSATAVDPGFVALTDGFYRIHLLRLSPRRVEHRDGSRLDAAQPSSLSFSRHATSVSGTSSSRLRCDRDRALVAAAPAIFHSRRPADWSNVTHATWTPSLAAPSSLGRLGELTPGKVRGHCLRADRNEPCGSKRVKNSAEWVADSWAIWTRLAGLNNFARKVLAPYRPTPENLRSRNVSSTHLKQSTYSHSSFPS